MKLNGIFAALTTPFDQNGDLAVDRIKENIARYNREPLTGYLAVGSTGESVFLSRKEIEQTFAAVREAAAPGRILLAGTGAESTRETISRTALAADLGYNFVLVKNPFYFKGGMTPDALVAHYRQVADASKLPILLYSIPQLTGIALEPDLVARLAEHPNIVGLKESSGNVQRVGEILAVVPANFQVMIGSADTLYPSLTLGATGGILAIADVIPELCMDLFRAASEGPSTKARELHRRLAPAAKKIVSGLGIAGVKHAMDRRGYYGGPVRSPLLPLNDAQKRAAETMIDSLVGTAAAD
ncbi:MAG: dihydrodipicolinate synthase family protein [Acidobacteriia bacterium]|nr:dihydrodipicolinate synthase family protein [Terriglobia bacterium]